MEFLGVGYQEILVILILALVVVGPERLPQVAFQIGRAVRQMQKYARAVRDEFSDEFQYLEEQYNTVRGDLQEAQDDLRREQRRLDSDMKRLDSEMEDLSKEIDASMPDEMKKDSRGNVIPISAAGQRGASANGANRGGGVRPATSASSSKPSLTGNTAASGGATQDKGDDAKEGQEAKSGPPLVF